MPALSLRPSHDDDFLCRTDLTDGEVYHSCPLPSVIRSLQDHGLGDQQVYDDPLSSSAPSDPPVVAILVHLVGRTSLIDKQNDGTIPRAQTFGMIEGNPMVGKDKKQKIIACNDLLNYLLRDEQASSVLRLSKQIILYKNVDHTHPDCGSLVNTVVAWENGEITPKPPTIVAGDDPVTCVIYAYGFAIPRNCQHTISLVRTNSNTRWFDDISVSLAQVDVYATSDDIGNASTVGPPKDSPQARLVADRHLTDVLSKAVHYGSVSLHGVHLVLTTTERNDKAALSMDDIVTPKHDSQVATVQDVRTTPSREQLSFMLDGSPLEAVRSDAGNLRGFSLVPTIDLFIWSTGITTTFMRHPDAILLADVLQHACGQVKTTGVDTTLGFERSNVNLEPSNVRTVPIDGEFFHPRKHIKFRMSFIPIVDNVDPMSPSQTQPTSSDVSNNIKLIIDVIFPPFVRTDMSNFALVWSILIFLCHPVKKFVFSKQAVAMAMVRPAPASADTSIIEAMFNVTALWTFQDIVDVPIDTTGKEATHTAMSSCISQDINGVPQDTCSSSNLTHAWWLCLSQTSTMFCHVSSSAMDWANKFQEPTPWIPLSIQDDKAILVTLNLLVESIQNYSLSIYLNYCSCGSSSRIGYYKHVKHIVGLQPTLCYMDNHLCDESCSKYIVGDKRYSVKIAAIPHDKFPKQHIVLSWRDDIIEDYYLCLWEACGTKEPGNNHQMTVTKNWPPTDWIHHPKPPPAPDPTMIYFLPFLQDFFDFAQHDRCLPPLLCEWVFKVLRFPDGLQYHRIHRSQSTFHSATISSLERGVTSFTLVYSRFGHVKIALTSGIPSQNVSTIPMTDGQTDWIFSNGFSGRLLSA